MRLVRVALASVNTTVGACRSNVDRAIAAARSRGRPTGPRWSPSPSSSSAATRPRTSCSGAPSSTRRDRSSGASRARPRRSGCASALGLVVARGAHLYNVRGAGARRARLGPRPQGEAAALQRLLRGAHARARGAGALTTSVDGVPFGDLVFELDFGVARARGVRGRLVARRARCAGAPTRARSWCVNAQRVALPRRHRRDAPRDDRHARGRQPGDGRLREPRRRQRRAGVRRRRLRRRRTGACSSSAPRFREGLAAVTVDLDRTRRLRTENTTWRDDHEDVRGAAATKPTRVRVDAPTAFTTARDPLVFPRAGEPELLSPRRRRAGLPAPSARPLLRRAARRARPRRRRLLREERVLQDHRRRALGGTRQPPGPRRRAPLDRHALARSARGRASGQGAGDPARASSCRRASRRPRRAPRPSRPRGTSTRPSPSCPSTTRFERELAAVEKMLQPGETLTAAGPPERAGPRPRRAHVDVGQRRRRAVPPDEQHEREGGRLHDHRRRRRGGARVIANVPKTVVNYLLDWLYEEQPAPRGSASRSSSRRAPSWPTDQEDERELMPFPVLDACFALFAGEKMAPDEVAQALRAMFPRASPRAARRLGARGSRASSRRRSTSGSRRRSRSTWATSTSSASARCSSRWCSERVAEARLVSGS